MVRIGSSGCGQAMVGNLNRIAAVTRKIIEAVLKGLSMTMHLRGCKVRQRGRKWVEGYRPNQ
jgi:hypothetical protein